MTLIVGNVVDVGLAGVDGTLRVWAWFRPEEVGLIAPYRREWEITGGEIEAGVDVIPGPAAVEIDCGPSAYTTVDVVVPDAESVAIQDLFEQVYSYTPGVVSEAWEARRGAEAAALEAELSAGEAEVSAGRALTSEEASALHAATLSARVDQGTQTVMYTSDGVPYLADPATFTTGDTGWRDISDSLINGWKASMFRVRRIGATVWLSVYNLDGREATEMRFCHLPSGFNNDPSGWGARLGGKTIEASGNQIMFLRGGVGQLHFGGGHWFAPILVTDKAWPTSLPGTPA